jgi:hypothetical protein
MSGVVACSEEARGHICRAGRENVLVVRNRFDLGVIRFVDVIAKGRGGSIAEDIVEDRLRIEINSIV